MRASGRRRTWLLLVGLGGLALDPGQASAEWWIEPAAQTCASWGVSPVLAMSVILAESGGQPYAIRVNDARAGYATFPRTHDAAVRLAEAAVRITANVDLGLMQVNYREWGRPLGLTPAQLVDPMINLQVGCAILRAGLDDGGPLWRRVGRYHSPDPARQRAYAGKVAGWLQALLSEPSRPVARSGR